jgi:Flp pilus assembly protein TadD
MQLESDDMRLLSELGLLAAGRNIRTEAETIAQALALWRPQSAIAGMIRGVAALSRSELEGAVRVLREEALKAEPSSEEAKALLGLALEKAGYRNAADQVLSPLAAAGGEGPGALAQAVLDARRGIPGAQG